jgi:RNA polymerase sigma-70 factor (ECF subfamily)
MGAAERVSSPSAEDELHLLERLRRGDEAAFATLIERYHRLMIRLAMIYVSRPAVAEEVVQETWLAVLQGLGRFEGRSSLQTWIFRILANRARTRGEREGRYVPFSALGDAGGDASEPTVDADRFLSADHGRASHHWAARPASWDAIPEDRFLAQETRIYIQNAIATLPANQQTVIVLRDIKGWTSEEVCNVLSISETNQRVLLHRARAKVRGVLEQYLSEA